MLLSLPPRGFACFALQAACPVDLSSEQAVQLQAWLPPGCAPSPGAWEEVYRATKHGFGAAAFHARCDGQTRLLLLVRASGWLFGGFTAMGFRPPPEGNGWYVDPEAFLFSLTNPQGCPEKLEPRRPEPGRKGNNLCYDVAASANFGHGFPADLYIGDDPDTSYTDLGRAYDPPRSSSPYTHPMYCGYKNIWRPIEIVAWAV